MTAANPASPDCNFAVQKIRETGFILLENIFSKPEVDQLIRLLEESFLGQNSGIKNNRGETYAARNLIDSTPGIQSACQHPALIAFLEKIIGPEFGLVRALYFDKHPDRTWSLGWHKDLTIAVRDHRNLSTLADKNASFSKPTTKSGIPHLEASAEILQNMVTLRIHLDPATEENGPLEVIPGSHESKSTQPNPQPSQKILAKTGDVLAMRPLISHASGSSKPGTNLHRRILHLEFSGQPELPDGFHWYHFIQPIDIDNDAGC